jgi:hypothetical protein
MKTRIEAWEWSLRLARSDDTLHHHDEQQLAFIPSADPAHPPAIDAISQTCGLAQMEEAGLDLPSPQSGGVAAGAVSGGNTEASQVMSMAYRRAPM